MRHCNTCTLKNGNSCDPRKMGLNIKTGKLAFGCGCNLETKTKSVKTECPLNKW